MEGRSRFTRSSLSADRPAAGDKPVPALAPRRAFPEAQALRALFRERALAPVYLMLWPLLTYVFLTIFWYGSFGSLTPIDIAVSIGFGGLLPLNWLLSWKARKLARERSACRPRGTLSGPAAGALGVLAGAVGSCASCTPIMGAILGAVLAGSALAAQATPIVATFAQWVPVVYAAASILLVWSLHRTSRWIAQTLNAP